MRFAHASLTAVAHGGDPQDRAASPIPFFKFDDALFHFPISKELDFVVNYVDNLVQ